MSSPTVRRSLRSAVRGAALVALALACSSTSQGLGDTAGSGGSGNGACATFTGGYIITDTCSGEKAACAVTQEGCAAQLACLGQPDRVIELSGNDATYTTPNHGICTGSLSNTLIDSTCEDGCGLQGIRLTTDPKPPVVENARCGFRISDVFPAATDQCDSCAEAAGTGCCSQMEACTAPSACNSLLVCVRKNCPIDANVATCAANECPALTAAGAPELTALVTCLQTTCESCGIGSL